MWTASRNVVTVSDQFVLKRYGLTPGPNYSDHYNWLPKLMLQTIIWKQVTIGPIYWSWRTCLAYVLNRF